MESIDQVVRQRLCCSGVTKLLDYLTMLDQTHVIKIIIILMIKKNGQHMNKELLGLENAIWMDQ